LLLLLANCMLKVDLAIFVFDMINIFENYSLDNLNSFKIEANTKYYCPVRNISDIAELANDRTFSENKKLILGGGSNILFTKNFPGVCIHPLMCSINLLKEDDKYAFIEVESGRDWDEFVEYTIKRNLSGLENLSFIPGSTGAAPVQNIGAYGVEVKDYIEKVIVIDINNGHKIFFSNSECGFDYRTSIFKKDFQNRYLIYSIIFRLNKQHKFNLEYSGIIEELADQKNPHISDVRNAIKILRNNKLPDVETEGTAGSFFKNPVVNSATLKDLTKEHKSIKYFNLPGDEAKIAAGWLIEHCGWKGKRIGDAGVYKNQALVIVNHGNASGQEILDLSIKIRESVYSRFSIQLEPELTII